MEFSDATIKKVLLYGNYVEPADIEKAEKYATDRRVSILEYLIGEELLTRELLGQAFAESFGVPYVDIGANRPPKDQVLLVPEETARALRIVVTEKKKDEVVVATDNPAQNGLAEALAPLFPGKKVSVSFSMADDIDAVFADYHQGLEAGFAKMIESRGAAAPEIINQIVEDALTLKASDIHFEPSEKKVDIRFRVDGVLHDAGEMPKEYYENIVNRLKVQAKMRIDEHFGAQDGAIRQASSMHKEPVDLRVSVVPTLDGEKVAIRVLASYVRNLTLSDIGLSEELQAQLVASSKKPFGMILVTGPTGSGKTTTLYSILKLINTRSVNITTIEDPVEYKISGVNQIQVNPQTNLTFAKGLRAVTRQDPNVIFVGEIRDLETADIAVNAALTGHLLLSSFHANNAATTIPRFIDMGVEPFLVGSTIELVISQRLVRRICLSCRVSYPAKKAELKSFGPRVAELLGAEGGEVTLFRGKGCKACAGTGFHGRIGVFEFLTATPELQDLIGQRPSTKDVSELVSSQGFKTMLEDGLVKVRDGVTSLQELVRVIGSR